MVDIAGKYKTLGKLYTATFNGVSNMQNTYNATYATDCKSSTVIFGAIGSLVYSDSCYHITANRIYSLF